MTRPDNPFFARNLANRVWAHFLGRGLVEPVDDVRATNPPTNPELLDALAHSVVENKYDVKKLIRTITASRVYQLSSKPNATNERDEQNYSRALFKRIDGGSAVGHGLSDDRRPRAFRRNASGDAGHPALGQQGVALLPESIRPAGAGSACECERRHEPSAAQVLHLINAPEIQAKLGHDAGTWPSWQSAKAATNRWSRICI